MFDELYGRPKASNIHRQGADVQSAYKSLMEDSQIEREISDQTAKIEQQMLFESQAAGLTNSSDRTRKQVLAENAKVRKSIMRTAVTNFLTECTMKGLVFDEYFLESNGDEIREKMRKFYKEAYDNNILTEASFANCDSYPMQDVLREMEELAIEMSENKDIYDVYNEESVIRILNEAPKSENLQDEISENVKGKVEDTLEREKKISKKKEEEKEDDEEEAADSLDDDVDETSGDDSDDDDSDGGDDDDLDDEDDGDDDLDDDEDDSDDDSDDEGDDDGEDDLDDDEDDSDSDDDLDDDSDSDDDLDDDSDSDDDLDDEDGDDDLDDDSSDGGDDKGEGMTITINTNGTKVDVQAVKKESADYINIGMSGYHERNEKTIFRNLLEANLLESTTKILSESGGFDYGYKPTVNMDAILGESIIDYTILETLYTSKLADFKPSDLKSINKRMNFNRR
jgi:hypothetical protein